VRFGTLKEMRAGERGNMGAGERVKFPLQKMFESSCLEMA